MERRRRSDIEHEYTRRARTSGIVIREQGAPAAATAATTNAAYIPAAPNAAAGEVNREKQQGFKREANQYMSIANITRIIRRVLPVNVEITDDAKEAIQECISEFIRVITAEANARCHRDYRKTVTPEDVLAAMASLGLDDYLEPLTTFLNKHRAQQDPERNSMNQILQFVRRGNAGGGDSSNGFVHPQQQQADQMVQSPLPTPAASTVGYYVHLPLPPSATVEEEEELGGLTNVIDEYMLRNHGGGGEGSSRGRDFDLF